MNTELQGCIAPETPLAQVELQIIAERLSELEQMVHKLELGLSYVIPGEREVDISALAKMETRQVSALVGRLREHKAKIENIIANVSYLINSVEV